MLEGISKVTYLEGWVRVRASWEGKQKGPQTAVTSEGDILLQQVRIHVPTTAYSICFNWLHYLFRFCWLAGFLQTPLTLITFWFPCPCGIPLQSVGVRLFCLALSAAPVSMAATAPGDPLTRCNSKKKISHLIPLLSPPAVDKHSSCPVIFLALLCLSLSLLSEFIYKFLSVRFPIWKEKEGSWQYFWPRGLFISCYS